MANVVLLWVHRLSAAPLLLVVHVVVVVAQSLKGQEVEVEQVEEIVLVQVTAGC